MPTNTISNAIAEASFIAKDTLDTLFQRRPPLVPPRRLMFDGPRDPAIFVQNGQEFLRYYIELCDLQPHERVLDIGSGIGRKAIPLIDYLSDAGSYTGFDINHVGIEWCRREITSRHPRFTFHHIDVHNGRYNPRGTQQPEEYIFPTKDNKFDFAVLTSVFTHMFPGGVRQYLHEVGRMLKPGGRSLISFFLLNETSKEQIQSGVSSLTFPFARVDHAIEREEQPEDAVAFNEDFIHQLYKEAGLAISEIYYGSWCGRDEFVSYQDLIVARKR
jgi:SAM-dependent methyltransferase